MFVMGTIGCIDPGYARTSYLTEKSDVYSYGFFLLELLTGRKSVNNDCNLHQLIKSKTANIAVTVDPEMSATCKNLGAIYSFFLFVIRGFFHGYSLVTTCMILNHALSGIAVSMVMKYADNIVKVYSTSVAMLLTAVVSVFLFGFHLSLAFFLGSTVVSVSVYLHSIGKLQK
ncbi:hypothetical protein GIB67_033672 [Kingdonia uniflora]|uniref:Protein kinase domain-containing protein n=1 Tax=Kingdonia uniflora TaxID=39325 RepID=A0A7J7P474_9MAGN|nr:hypothetical protein GIB67_033672 [Kingdonia uniflora]